MNTNNHPGYNGLQPVGQPELTTHQTDSDRESARSLIEMTKDLFDRQGFHELAETLQAISTHARMSPAWSSDPQRDQINGVLLNMLTDMCRLYVATQTWDRPRLDRLYADV